jgi:hypothetical protein
VEWTGRALVLLGLAVAALGVLLWLAPHLPLVGRLPGDLRIERPGLRIYVPLTTSLLLSALISAALWLASRWR